MKTARWFIGSALSIPGTISLAWATPEGVETFDNDTMIWIFLGMCALIIIGQLLPAFRAVTPKEKIAVRPLAEAKATTEARGDEGGIPDKEH